LFPARSRTDARRTARSGEFSGCSIDLGGSTPSTGKARTMFDAINGNKQIFVT
jgi:hypothetical protein